VALARVQAQIRALFVEAAGGPLDAGQAERYRLLLDADYAARQGLPRGREGEDESAPVASAA
jgi:hypothetical protein